MSNIKSLVITVLICLALMGAAVVYHLKTVGGLEDQLATARQEVQTARDAHNNFIAGLMRETAEAFRRNAESVDKALKAREGKHEEVRQEGKNVMAVIAAEPPASGGADIDKPLPDSIAAGLMRLHEKAVGGGSGGGAADATGGSVSAKAPAGAAKGKADRPQAGDMDGGTAGVVR